MLDADVCEAGVDDDEEYEYEDDDEEYVYEDEEGEHPETMYRAPLATSEPSVAASEPKSSEIEERAPSDKGQAGAQTATISGPAKCKLILWAHGYTIEANKRQIGGPAQRDYADELGAQLISAIDVKHGDLRWTPPALAKVIKDALGPDFQEIGKVEVTLRRKEIGPIPPAGAPALLSTTMGSAVGSMGSSMPPPAPPQELRSSLGQGLALRPTAAAAEQNNSGSSWGSSGGHVLSSSTVESPDAVAFGADTRRYYDTFKLREEEPITTLSIRTHDGKRHRTKFNPARHTVSDLHGFVQAMSIGSNAGHTHYQLLAGFPPRPLPRAQDHATIEAAGLSGSSVTQRLC